MFKTGSKFLYGVAAFGFVAAIVYAIATGGEKVDGVDTILGPLTLGYKGGVGDHVGFTILVVLSAASFFLAVLLASIRDGDAEAAAKVVGVETVPEVAAPATVNYWPVVAAFSAAAVVLGLAIGSGLFVIGCIGLTVATAEWAISAWSDRITGDPAVNTSIRNRMMHPIEIPVAAVLGIGIFVLAISRILLALPKNGSYLVFGIVPAIIFGVGILIVTKPKLSRSVIAGLLLFGGFAVLAGGVAASIAGEREHEGGEHHEEEEGGEHGGRIAVSLPEPGQTVIRVAN
ncbi:hypothetical protein ACE2AJ_10370 [Aquihabitans daechungensis]|uniref:hypothetical protein n=1 Tax=Aquihabitans daechungensis TaxID=1052257 RepID=UPI003BA04287